MVMIARWSSREIIVVLLGINVLIMRMDSHWIELIKLGSKYRPDTPIANQLLMSGNVFPSIMDTLLVCQG